jgi:hypothetical protein
MAPQEALVLNEQPVPRLVDESAEPIPPGSRAPDDVASVAWLEGLAVPVGLEAFDDLGHLVAIGLAHDVFGNGKTALKVSLNKYMVAQGLQGIYGDQADPIGRLANMVTRSWNDFTFPVGDPRRGNFVPDCSLTNPVLNDECGVMSNTAFGSTIPATTYDPAALVGWGVRPDSWEFVTRVQHEVLPACR